MNTSSLGEHVKKYLWVIIVGPTRGQVNAIGLLREVQAAIRPEAPTAQDWANGKKLPQAPATRPCQPPMQTEHD